MARPSEEFVLAWLSLSGDDEIPGWQAIPLPSAGPIEVQAGRCSPNNAEAVLFTFPSARLARAEKLPEGKGFLVEKAGTMEQKVLQLALTRQLEGNLEQFTAMVCDVVGTMDEVAEWSSSESNLLQVLIRRIRAWQQFMSRHTGLLGPEEELGLVGELYFITVLLDSCVPAMDILNAWVGPDDASQDFHLGDGAIEVKATMSSSGFPVKIGSLEQLDDGVASPLFLAAIKFTRQESGLTLPDMIAEIVSKIKDEPDAVNFFRERLMCVGYCESHSGCYTRKYEVKEKCLFSVSEDFPRMTTGSVPAGITRALYEINLNQVRDYQVDLNSVLKKLGVIG